MSKRITQADVARAAGVSRFTVSCVVNNLSGGNVRVSDETRRRVMEVVEQLGYVPDRVARSLRTHKTYTIACIIPDITNPFYPAFARGIQDVARRHNYNLLLLNTDGIVEQERKSLEAARASQVEGIIYSQFHLTEEELLAANVPVVLYSEQSVHFDHLSVDNVRSAFDITSHLILTGHSRIAIIAGEKGTPACENRLKGFRQALAAHHLAEDQALIHYGDFTEKGGAGQMRSLLDLPERPTAVFAANDLIALGALLAIREAGLRVPQDIALAGFDDIPTATYTSPALTTVRQFQYNVGRKAAEMLFDRIEGQLNDGPRWVEMPYEIVVRESSGTIAYENQKIEDEEQNRSSDLLEELQRSEAQFKAMFETSAVGIGIQGLDRKIIDANPAMCRMLGLTGEELIGQTPAVAMVPDDYPQSTHDFIARFAGTQQHILDYLVEDVLLAQPRNVQLFLMQTSILVRMTGALCEAITSQAQAAEMPTYLDKTNLFLIPLDGERRWYRYHDLFSSAIMPPYD